MYLRFVALGDSTTFGIGDPVPGGWRGWARLLSSGLDARHQVSFCNLAVPGGTAAVVRDEQLETALSHSPDLAALIVGINDTMRSSWEPRKLRQDLLTTAEALHETGALLLTARFHDHGAVFGLPGVLRRPLLARIETVNLVSDEIHRRFGSLQIDLAAWPQVQQRRFWSIDRLHPSELGHRALAHGYATLLAERGLDLEVPSLAVAGGSTPRPVDDAWWMLTEGVPWLGRRARDLGPWAARLAWTETTSRRRREHTRA